MPDTQNKRVVSWVYIPVIFVLGYVPLIVRGIAYRRELLSEQIWFPEGTSYDFFLYAKAIAIMVSAAVAVVFFIFDKKKLIKKEWLLLPLLFYAFFVLLSGLLSPWRDLSLAGSYEMMEGFPVILSYVILCLVAFSLIARDGLRGVYLIATGATPGILLVLFFGFLQSLGIELLKTDFGASLVASPEILNEYGTLSTDPDNPVFSTLYNADNAGVYFVLIAALMAGLCIGTEKMWQKCLFAIACGVAVYDALATGTATAVIALVALVAVIWLIWLLRREGKVRKIGLIATACAVGIALMLSAFVPVVRNRIDAALNISDPYVNHLKGIDTGSFGIEFEFDDGIYHVFWDDKDKVPRTLSSADTLEYLQSSVISFDNSDPSRIVLKVDIDLGEGQGITSWNFVYYPEKRMYYFINPAGKEESFPDVPKVAETFSPTLFNHRGNIWNHTLPKLKNYLLTGVGANNFIMAYPQNDYISEIRFGDRFIDVKPHSFYIQQWVDHGFFGFAALMIFLFWLLAKGILTLIKTERGEPYLFVAGGLVLAVIAQLIMGITQDGNVCSSPVFWIAVGMLLGLSSRQKV